MTEAEKANQADKDRIIMYVLQIARLEMAACELEKPNDPKSGLISFTGYDVQDRIKYYQQFISREAKLLLLSQQP